MNAAIIQIVVAFIDINGTINHIHAAYLVDIKFDTLGRNAYIARQLASLTNYLKMVVVFHVLALIICDWIYKNRPYRHKK